MIYIDDDYWMIEIYRLIDKGYTYNEACTKIKKRKERFKLLWENLFSI